MSGMPQQGTVEERVARSLDDETLAHRIEMIHHSRRAFGKQETDDLPWCGEEECRDRLCQEWNDPEPRGPHHADR